MLKKGNYKKEGKKKNGAVRCKGAPINKIKY